MLQKDDFCAWLESRIFNSEDIQLIAVLGGYWMTLKLHSIILYNLLECPAEIRILAKEELLQRDLIGLRRVQIKRDRIMIRLHC